MSAIAIGGLGLGSMAGLGAGAAAGIGGNIIGGGFNKNNKLDLSSGWASQIINGIDAYNFSRNTNNKKDLQQNNTSETSENESENEKNDLYAYMEEQKRQQWEREDKIRRETQAREDNAWQRAIADMQAAGVNPNLVNAQPAESGGGITNATGNDYGGLQAELSAEIQKYAAELQENTADQDRTSDILKSLATTAAMIGIAYFSKGKIKTK